MTYKDFYLQLENFLIKNNFVKSEDIKAYSKNELKSFEEAYNIILPDSYKEFLKVFGESELGIFNNQYFGLDHIDASFETAEHLLGKPLEKDSFAFAQWQGYNFHFFTLSNNQNPDVIFGTITSDDPSISDIKQINEGPFSSWVCNRIINMLNLKMQLKKGDFSNPIQELEKLKQQLTHR